MQYLHTMVRVSDLDQSLKFYCDALGLRELRRTENEKGRFTLVFLAAPNDERAQVELTYNWDEKGYRRRAQLRAPRLCGRRHLRDLREAAGGGRHDQSAAARWTHGVRALARQHLGRALAAGRSVATRMSPGSRCPTSDSGDRAGTFSSEELAALARARFGGSRAGRVRSVRTDPRALFFLGRRAVSLAEPGALVRVHRARDCCAEATCLRSGTAGAGTGCSPHCACCWSGCMHATSSRTFAAAASAGPTWAGPRSAPASGCGAVSTPGPSARRR